MLGGRPWSEWIADLTAADFREPGAALAGDYVLAVAGLLVAVELLFHPLGRSAEPPLRSASGRL